MISLTCRDPRREGTRAPLQVRRIRYQRQYRSSNAPVRQVSGHWLMRVGGEFVLIRRVQRVGVVVGANRKPPPSIATHPACQRASNPGGHNTDVKPPMPTGKHTGSGEFYGAYSSGAVFRPSPTTQSQVETFTERCTTPCSLSLLMMPNVALI